MPALKHCNSGVTSLGSRTNAGDLQGGHKNTIYGPEIGSPFKA